MDVDPALWTMLGGTAAAAIAGWTAVRVEGIRSVGKKAAADANTAAGAAAVAADAAAVAADNSAATSNGFAARTRADLTRILEGQASDRETLRHLMTGQQQLVDSLGQTVGRLDHLAGRVDGLAERVRAVERPGAGGP